MLAAACKSYDEAADAPASDAGADTNVGPALDSGNNSDAPLTWSPPRGAYRYKVTGQQHLSVGNPDYRTEGPVAPAQIRDGKAPGCWLLRLCLVSGKCDDNPADAYSEVTWTFCLSDGALELRASDEITQWAVALDMQRAVSSYTCMPGQAPFAPKEFSVTQWSQVCQGTVGGKTYATSGPHTFVGKETVHVGAVDVPAYHFHQERTVTKNVDGAPNGSQVGEYWLRADGLPLRIRRGVKITTDLGFGVVDFTQTTSDKVDAGAFVPDDCVLDSVDPSPL